MSCSFTNFNRIQEDLPVSPWSTERKSLDKFIYKFWLSSPDSSDLLNYIELHFPFYENITFSTAACSLVFTFSCCFTLFHVPGTRTFTLIRIHLMRRASKKQANTFDFFRKENKKLHWESIKHQQSVSSRAKKASRKKWNNILCLRRISNDSARCDWCNYVARRREKQSNVGHVF